MSYCLLTLADDDLTTKVVARFAAINGLELHEAFDPEGFLRLLSHWRPDFLLLDVWRHGSDFLTELARKQGDAALLCVSPRKHGDPDEVRRELAARGINVTGVIQTPLSFAALRRLLRYAICRTRGALAGPAFMDSEVLSSQLRQAIDEQRIRIAYQPKIACGSGDVAGFEALVRWHFSNGLVAFPDSFIPIAEQSNLIEWLTLQVLERSMRWREGLKVREPPAICVNLSATMLTHPEFIERVLGECQARGIDPGAIVFELTETAAVDDPALALEFVTRLRMKGFHAAMDDVGTGHSSFLQLARLPFSELKVDRSFVMATPETPKARAIIRSFVQLGHNLGMQVIAEGVENQNALDFLTDAECDMAQGYHIARPMSAALAAEWLAQRHVTRQLLQ